MQIKLEGENLALAAQIDGLYKDGMAFRQKLEKEFESRWNFFQEESNAKTKEIMNRLGETLGVNMEEHEIDGTYFEEHGLMFVVPLQPSNNFDISRVVREAMEATA